MVHGKFILCGPKSFNTRLQKFDSTYHTAPLVSKAPFSIS